MTGARTDPEFRPAGLEWEPPPAGSRNRLVAFLDPRPGAGRFASLYGCRAVAAISVVVYHVAGYAGLSLGDTVAARVFHNLATFGVATFFVLSGFLLYLPFVTSHFADTDAPDPVLSLRRRFLRIWPAYLLALGVFVLLGLDTARTPGPDHWFTLVSLTQVYRRGYGLAGLGVAWTLCIEVAFYLALPFLAAGIRGFTRLAAGGAGRRGPSGPGAERSALSPRQKVEGQLVGLATLAAVGLIYRWFVAGPSFTDPETYPFAVFHLWLFNYLDWFALGMALAVAVAWRDLGRPLPGTLTSLAERGWLCWLLAAACYASLILGLGAVAANGGASAPADFVRETTTQMFARFELDGLAAALFLLPGILGTGFDPVNRALAGLVPLYLGTVSYGIYLWHRVWLDKIKADSAGATRLGFWVVLVVVSVLTLLTASLSYHLVERPLLRVRGPREGRTPEPAPPERP